MVNNVVIAIAIILTLVWALGIIFRQDYRTHTNIRVVVFWILSLGAVWLEDIPGIHLIYVFPLAIIFSLWIITIYTVNPTKGFIPSIIIWLIFLGVMSWAFGSFL